jgi:hypothetical protein
MNHRNPPYPHHWSSQFLIDESQEGADRFDRDAFAAGWGVILGVRYCVPVSQHPAFDFAYSLRPRSKFTFGPGSCGGTAIRFKSDRGHQKSADDGTSQELAALISDP